MSMKEARVRSLRRSCSSAGAPWLMGSVSARSGGETRSPARLAGSFCGVSWAARGRASASRSEAQARARQGRLGINEKARFMRGRGRDARYRDSEPAAQNDDSKKIAIPMQKVCAIPGAFLHDNALVGCGSIPVKGDSGLGEKGRVKPSSQTRSEEHT